MAINVIDKIKHASGGAVADAAEIEMADGTRLDAVVEAAALELERTNQSVAELTAEIPASLTQAQYDTLEDAGLVTDGRTYLIVRASSYTPHHLTQAQMDALETAGLLPEEDDA